jgi:uncharacterized coiled-coil protein SlyX
MNFKEREAKPEVEDANARGRIAALEKRSNQHSHVLAILQDKLTELSTDVGRLVGEVSALRCHFISILSDFLPISQYPLKKTPCLSHPH